MTPDAIAYYHDLLIERHAQSTIDILGSVKNRLVVSGRPVCNVLRPYFIEATLYSQIMRASILLMRGIAVLRRRLMQDSKLRLQMNLTAAEETIIHVDSGYGFPDVSARLDGFLSAENHFAFVEYNSDSPGGIGYGDELAELFATMPVSREFSKRYPFQIVPTRSIVFESLLRAFHRWGGKGLPAIGIIDWKEAVTRPEFLLFQEFFEKHGCRVKIGDPRDLEYRNGGLYLGDFHIELVYKRLVVAEMLDRLGCENVLVQAARDHAVCVAPGLGVQLAFRKSLFAMLSDPVHSGLFDADVQQVIRKQVPWTRNVQECKTTYNDNEVDLLPHILHNRESFVLKPAADYGGRGVVLGWNVTSQEWESALNHAINHPYVVQERVQIGSESFPSMDGEQLIFADRFFDLDPYVWNGERSEGCGVRLSSVPLLNVSAGGGSATPLFILQT